MVRGSLVLLTWSIACYTDVRCRCQRRCPCPRPVRILRYVPRLAFWAEGWSVECARYSERYSYLLDTMGDHIGDVLSENATIFYNYLTSNRTETLQNLAWCATTASVSMTGTPIDVLVDRHVELLEERFGNESLVLNIDSAATVTLICGKRLEKVRCYLIRFGLEEEADLVSLRRGS